MEKVFPNHYQLKLLIGQHHCVVQEALIIYLLEYVVEVHPPCMAFLYSDNSMQHNQHHLQAAALQVKAAGEDGLEEAAAASAVHADTGSAQATKPRSVKQDLSANSLFYTFE